MVVQGGLDDQVSDPFIHTAWLQAWGVVYQGRSQEARFVEVAVPFVGGDKGELPV